VGRFSDVEPLGGDGGLDEFDCGEPSLNAWLSRYARAAAGAGSARTYVTVDRQQDRVVGYHALTAAQVEHADATERVRRGMPRHQLPVILLARLAVDRSVQGRGIGSWLLADAMRRSVGAAERVGIRALVVHALDERAGAFYEKHGLSPSPSDPQHLMILVKDIRAALERAEKPA
jgi:GNAT superfamily N-acetyltransferase